MHDRRSSRSRVFPGFGLVLTGMSLTAILPACACSDSGHHDEQHLAIERALVDGAWARLTALQGEWIDATGAASPADAVHVVYRVTGGGSAVVETLFPGTANEMVTVYHRDGRDLVLTHYCSAGNQPRMRARKISDTSIDFAFAGGANIDPARDVHMHSAQVQFVGPDELHWQWQGWADGRPDPEHLARFRFTRKPD